MAFRRRKLLNIKRIYFVKSGGSACCRTLLKPHLFYGVEHSQLLSESQKIRTARKRRPTEVPGWKVAYLIMSFIRGS